MQLQKPSLIFSVTLLLLNACNTKPLPVQKEEVLNEYSDTLPGQLGEVDDGDGENAENMEVTMYVVMADSGKDYWKLENEMFALNKVTGLAVDTMNRHYDEQKSLVVLADEDEDEMYRGNYFPRRYGSDFLSIEMLSSFQNEADANSFALVCGLFENKNSADSMAAVIKKQHPAVFVMSSTIYMGCIH